MITKHEILLSFTIKLSLYSVSRLLYFYWHSINKTYLQNLNRFGYLGDFPIINSNETIIWILVRNYNHRCMKLQILLPDVVGEIVAVYNGTVGKAELIRGTPHCFHPLKQKRLRYLIFYAKQQA